MTKKEIRRLWFLSNVATHSKDSLEELKTLVRKIIIGYLETESVPCDLCARRVRCENNCDRYPCELDFDICPKVIANGCVECMRSGYDKFDMGETDVPAD